ncbi:hypothetical protein ADUPG1_002200, partial [Aduncisulcus paluster]
NAKARLESRITELIADRDAVRASYTAEQRKYADVCSKLSDMEDLQSAFAKCVESKSACDGERQHLRIANDKLQDENRLLISQVATLKEQQRAKEQKCSALTDELEKVKGDYNDVSSRLSHLS